MTAVPDVLVPADLLLRLSMLCYEVPVLYDVQDLESQERADADAVMRLMRDQVPGWVDAYGDRLADYWYQDPARAAMIASARGLFPTVEYRPADAVAVLGREEAD